MVHTVAVKSNKKPRIGVQAEGLVLCDHALTLRQAGVYYWTATDDNVKDREPKDLDPAPQTELYGIDQQLGAHLGINLFRWQVDIAALKSVGEIYAVTIALLQDRDFTVLARYTSQDEGHGPLTGLRHETGWAILDVS